jgi:hypothetical protein
LIWEWSAASKEKETKFSAWFFGLLCSYMPSWLQLGRQSHCAKALSRAPLVDVWKPERTPLFDEVLDRVKVIVGRLDAVENLVLAKEIGQGWTMDRLQKIQTQMAEGHRSNPQFSGGVHMATRGRTLCT